MHVFRNVNVPVILEKIYYLKAKVDNDHAFNVATIVHVAEDDL